MKRKYFIALVFAMLFFSAFTQNQDDENCFRESTIESGFIAITTGPDSKLADWYQQKFGMQKLKEFTSADSISSGVILQKDKFVLEIIFRRDLLNRNILEPNAKHDERSGLLKFGIFTNAYLPEIKQCLVKNGVNAGRIFRDHELGEDLLLIRDPEGNMMELISRISNPG